ncbi:MAG: PepSY domain-containing protein [Proteobacteria bacterium]|nr:PepSY domain-containing protein [Pseudomonadota bacterium]
MPNHRLLKFLRSAHLYLGVFTAPALLFFAFTGALQSFDLHEAARGSDYRPPAWLQSLAHLHKKQSLDVPARRAPPRGAEPAQDRAAGASASDPIVTRANDAGAEPQRTPGDRASDVPRRNLLPMKIYFALVALSLFLSTLTGLYMASRMSRHARRIAATFAAGVLVPLLLLVF